jgi:uncharacterized protein
MTIVFALNHPAHYYLFKYIISGLREKGHTVFLLVKGKDVLEDLLDLEKQKYFRLIKRRERKGNALSIMVNGLIELIVQNFRLNKVVRNLKPDIMVGTDTSIAHIGWMKRTPSFVYNEDDYEINQLFCRFTYPFADFIVAPKYTSVGPFEEKKIKYYGMQKMAYLNPKYYEPNPQILHQLKIKENDPFFIIRLVSLTAGHDIEGEHKGINEFYLEKIIKHLEKRGKVFITSEKALSSQYDSYRISIAANQMHDLMYYSHLFIGDSQTMCAEAGLLGTPFIRINDYIGKIEYLNILENRYKMGWGVHADEQENVLRIVKEIFEIDQLREKWQIKRKRIFLEMENLTEYSINLLHRFPESVENTPDTNLKLGSIKNITNG